ncbi:MAG: hypothetical protein JKY71_11685 [Alphaproteobacteria bacterium]|nr:hypothetical protein [Alphaproteobacteria bacterium]
MNSTSPDFSVTGRTNNQSADFNTKSVQDGYFDPKIGIFGTTHSTPASKASWLRSSTGGCLSPSG